MKREWFDNLSKEVLNPDYALFTQSADGMLKKTIVPPSASTIPSGMYCWENLQCYIIHRHFAVGLHLRNSPYHYIVYNTIPFDIASYKQ